MDTSKKYIEMCKKAVELQEAWEPAVGDTYLDSTYGELVLSCGCIDVQYLPERRKVSFFLPKQDQFQDMIEINYSITHQSDGKILFSYYSYEYGGEIETFESSVEQGLLNAVMKEKYGKTWNGEEWQ